jgi:hypothetical protein
MLTRGGRFKYQNSQHLPGPTKIPLERGADPVGSSIEEHEAAIRSELAKWRKVSKAAGVKPR